MEFIRGGRITYYKDEPHNFTFEYMLDLLKRKIPTKESLHKVYAKKYGNFLMLVDPLRFIKSPRKSLKAYKIESILKEVNKNF